MKRIFVLIVLIMNSGLYAAGKGDSSFQDGKRNFEKGNYSRALELLGNAVMQSDDSVTRTKSYYYQGLALFELGLYYSSFTSFKNVMLSSDGRSSEMIEKTVRNMVSIMDKFNRVGEVGEILERASASYPSSINSSVHYAKGVYAAARGQNESALSHLKSVSPDSAFAMKAFFQLGVLSTKLKNYKEAVFYFDKVVSKTYGKREHFPMQELARLNLARSLYSSGSYERSVETYAQFPASSTHWLTVLLEASWPLMRVSDTAVSLGNLHTMTSPRYRDQMLGEAYILRSTILFNLCKYEEMRKTLAEFFTVYDPILRNMQSEQNRFSDSQAFYRAFMGKSGLNEAFRKFLLRDEGIRASQRILELLSKEKRTLAKYKSVSTQVALNRSLDQFVEKTEAELGATIRSLHARKLRELGEQREQANYLKVEIVTGEKELIEGQKGLPPKRVVDIETSVADGFEFWPYQGEFWEDELGAFVYTTESSCVN